MKVGDLVRYKPCVQGLENRLGIVICFNGELPTIQWYETNDMQLVGEFIDPPSLIEVVNEGR